ncbi:Transposase zinc-ribbon domain-containing protein [Fibrobacter sp. UWR3]|uniref:IS1595 family transposase n=1 Tax=Fibrobacter sp. UWR3 TaxID=1896217 RepID=UPI00091EB2BA|nr:IS1595 family transposase [Fibrobacter sp. UWR3]SHM56641.1 Transposase zinc-ribbon domain-containing protein [Fibrobacter sp. UWR3]
MNDHVTISLYKILKKFPDNETARKFLERKRWGDTPTCPYCSYTHSVARTDKKLGFYRCNHCRKEYSVRTNSIFANSKVGLDKWVIAMYLMVTARKGVSSMQLSKELDITQKTAWFLCHRIRSAMGNGKYSGLLQGIVEMDETYVGGKEANKHNSKKLHEGRGSVGKTPVVGIVERGGRVRSFVTADTTQLTLQGLVALNVQKGAVVNTDEFRGYGDLSEKGYVHNRVNHSAKLYVDGKAYTNGIESVWSLVKRGFYGTFHKFTLEHLQRYVDEFDFRWNKGNCKVPTDERIDSLVCGCWGKTLNYRTLVA